jgi:hypothetical protein
MRNMARAGRPKLSEITRHPYRYLHSFFNPSLSSPMRLVVCKTLFCVHFNERTLSPRLRVDLTQNGAEML